MEGAILLMLILGGIAYWVEVLIQIKRVLIDKEKENK